MALLQYDHQICEHDGEVKHTKQRECGEVDSDERLRGAELRRCIDKQRKRDKEQKVEEPLALVGVVSEVVAAVKWLQQENEEPAENRE